MAANPCVQLQAAGTAVWLDQLSREILRAGKLAALMEDAALTGVTSNPAIFHKAMTTGDSYDRQLSQLAASALSTEAVYEELAIRDIQMACDTLKPIHDRTDGADGYVSLEVSPHLARDAEGTYEAARDLHARVGRPNLLIKIPGTEEGLPAIERCLAEGVPINVTLLFSLESYKSVARVYIRALQRRAEQRRQLAVASVASFFVSRIDSLTDQRLDEAAGRAGSDSERNRILALKGKAAVANARLAYQSYKKLFGSEDFRQLAARGAWVQRPLWASTSTKDPAYSDVLYVETLVGPDTVNTMPLNTIEAFLDHGAVTRDSVEEGLEEARALFRELEEFGIPFTGITDQLLEEGIRKFEEPYDALLATLEEKRASLRASG